MMSESAFARGMHAVLHLPCPLIPGIRVAHVHHLLTFLVCWFVGAD